MRTPHLGLGLFSMADTSAVGGAVGGRKGGRFWKRPAGSFPKTLVAIGVWHSILVVEQSSFDRKTSPEE